MQSRRDFAKSQRSSNIFDEEDQNTIRSPNHDRSKPKDAYREALQMQMESDKQLRDYNRAHEEDHPLEMRVERVSLKKNRDVIGGVAGEDIAQQYHDDGTEFFIGADERNKRGQQKQIARDYASQLDEDLQLRRMRDQRADDDYCQSNRKPYERAHSPLAPEHSGFFIGRDEVAEKAKKKQQAVDFYRSERQRLGDQPSSTQAKQRRSRQAAEEVEDYNGLNIGRDEKESLRQQARMKVSYTRPVCVAASMSVDIPQAIFDTVHITIAVDYH